MNFLAPELLLGLLLIPLAIGFYLWAQRRRTKYAVRFTNLALLANLAPKRPSWRRHLPPALYLTAIAALLIGLARPTMVLAVPREDATVDPDHRRLRLDEGDRRVADPPGCGPRLRAVVHRPAPAKIRVGLVGLRVRAGHPGPPTTDRDQLKSALDSLRPSTARRWATRSSQVLDIAEKIQAEARDARRLAAPSASPPPRRAPSSSAARTRPAPRPTARRTSRSSPRSCCPTARTRSVRPSPRRRRPCGEARGPGLHDRAGHARWHGRRSRQLRPDGHAPGPAGQADPPADRRHDRRQGFDAPTAEDLKQVYDNLESRIGFTQETQEVTFAFVGAGLLMVVLGAGLAAVWFGRLP
jgi:Ca-activated chloride channel family protein